MKSIADVINKYSEYGVPESRRGITAKISLEAHLKLETVAAHFGVKKTPFLGELIEGAVNDIFDQVYSEFEEALKMHYHEEAKELEQQEMFDHLENR